MVPPCSGRISRVPPYSSLQHRVTCTGLSPATAQLSRRFHLSLLKHWPGPRSLATTSGVSVDVLSSGYLDVSVPRVCFYSPMYSGIDTFLVITGNPRSHCRRRGCFVGIRSAKQYDLEVPAIEGGLPHSEICGSTVVRTSPQLIAAYHVLHRLLPPRHPPDALRSLDCSH